MIELVYAAAMQPTEWPAFLESFARAMDSEVTAIHIHNCSTHEDYSNRFAEGHWTYGTAEWAMREYSEWAPRNVMMQAAAPLMRTGVVFEHLPLPKADLVGSEFYQEFLRRIVRTAESCGACIVFDEPMSAVISAFRHVNKPDYDRGDNAIVRALVPHLQRAMSIHRRLGMAELRRATLEDVLDRLGSAVFVLDERGRVIVHNRTASSLLDGADGLSFTASGELCAAGSGDDAHLQQLIGDACRTGVGRGMGAGGALQVRRPSGRRPYTLIISPLVLPHVVLVTQRPSAVVFATDLDAERAPADALRELFHLTPAEARVAELLVRGERAGDIADQLQLALPTVRTHIRRLLDKTGARGQPDLIRILAALPARFDTNR